jgi:3-oxoacyl-[acyl-carrier-protein] synthase-3
MHYIYQDGKAVFKVAVVGMADVSYEMMQKYNLSSDDVKYLVPHQANLRIIDATAKRMGVGPEKVMINIQKYGNTTAATIPLCLTEYYREGKIKRGDKLILAAFGAGYTWGSGYLVWSLD